MGTSLLFFLHELAKDSIGILAGLALRLMLGDGGSYHIVGSSHYSCCDCESLIIGSFYLCGVVSPTGKQIWKPQERTSGP